MSQSISQIECSTDMSNGMTHNISEYLHEGCEYMSDRVLEDISSETNEVQRRMSEYMSEYVYMFVTICVI